MILELIMTEIKTEKSQKQLSPPSFYKIQGKNSIA